MYGHAHGGNYNFICVDNATSVVRIVTEVEMFCRAAVWEGKVKQGKVTGRAAAESYVRKVVCVSSCCRRVSGRKQVRWSCWNVKGSCSRGERRTNRLYTSVSLNSPSVCFVLPDCIPRVVLFCTSFLACTVFTTLWRCFPETLIEGLL